MDKDKLLALRQKKLDAKNNQHKQILEAQEEVRKEIKNLAESISGAAFDWEKFKSHIDELGKLVDVRKEVVSLSSELDKVHKDALKVKDLDTLINAIDTKNNSTVIEAINSLKKSLSENKPAQKPEDFVPMRRVIKIGSILQFDDKPQQAGGGGGGGVQPAMIRDTANGKAIAVVNPDGTNVSGGSGGGGDASAAKQDEQTALLTQIEGNQLPNNHQVTVSNQITQPTTPADTQPVDTGITGYATETKQDDIITAIGGIGQPTTYTTRIDEASATVTYIGDAAIGSLTSAVAWRIKKIDTTSGTAITFADGNGNFDNIWDNRASLTYS